MPKLSSTKKNNLLVYLIIAGTLLVTQPAYQFFTIYQRDLGFDLSYVGIIAAAAAVFDMIGRFSAGVLSDRKGRKRPLLYLVLATMLFPFLLIHTRSENGVLLISVLRAVVNAAFWTVIIAYLYDTNPKEQGGRVYSKALMALLAINLASPIIGGVIIEKLGYPWLFAISCYATIIPLVLVTLLKKPATTRQPLSVKGEVNDIIEKPRFVKVWTTMLLVSLSSAFITTFFPIYLREQVGLTYQQVGLFFTGGTLLLLAAQPFLGWLADRFRSKVIIPANLLLMGAGLVLLAAASSVWSIFLTKSLIPLGIFGARAKGAANVAKLTPNEEHALAQALFKSSTGIGWAIMNAVSPILIASIGYAGVFRTLGAISALAGTWYFFAYRSKERDAHEGFLDHLKHHHDLTFSDTAPLEQHRHPMRKA